MGIRLCNREARTSANGPPSRTPRPAGRAGPGLVARTRAAGCQAARGAAAPPGPGPSPCAARASVHHAQQWRHRRHGPKQQTAATATHTEPTPTEPDRAPTDARPRPSASRPHSQILPSRTPRLLRVASTVHPPALTTLTDPLTTRSSCPVAAAPPRPASTRLGWPAQVYLAGRGREASAQRWPPFLESPGAERRTRRGGAAARSRLRRTPRDEHQETNTKKRTPPERTSARAG